MATLKHSNAKQSTKSRAKPQRLSTKRKSSAVRTGTLANLGKTPKLLLTIALIFAVVFGGIGLWKLVASNADTGALSAEQCYNRGRVYSSGLCRSWNCLSGAGAYTNTNVQYGYCVNAQSNSVSSSYCTNTLHRNYNSGSGGCARRWNGTFGNTFTNAWQCANNSWTYVMASPYDYCKSPTTTTTTPSTSTGWVWPLPSTKHLGSYSWNEYISGSGYHSGIDIGEYDGSTAGDTVVAAHAGKVSSNSYYSSSCGHMVIIKADGTNYWSGYQHLGTKTVSDGQYVAAGQKIGTVSSSTTSCQGGSFHHLHFSVEKGDWLSYYSSSPQTKSISPCGVLPGC